MKGMGILVIVMLVSLAIAGLWDNIPAIKNAVHTVLDPTAGALLTWHVTLGMVIISAIIVLLTTLLQKYTTDQKTLKEIKDEQKKMREEMKLYKEHPEKMMELNKRSMELVGKAMPLSMRPLLYTAIPIVLFFRWFGDYFTAQPTKILGMSWLIAYIIFSIIFSTIFRKAFNVH